MNLQKQTREPIVWMNVTTSANWNRPPVGIVRVEEALCNELEKLLGSTKFKRCVWQDGDFIESIPKSNLIDEKVGKVVDIIFPKTPSFDIPRKFLARAFEAFQMKRRPKDTESELDSFEINVPLNTNSPLRPAPGDVLISVGLDWDQPYTSEFFNLSKKRGIKIVSCCYDLIPVLFPQYCVGDVATRFKEYFNMLTWGSAAVLCISERTRRDYLALCTDIGAPKRLTSIIPLGDNVPADVGHVSEQIQTLIAEPFILFVSTIERRKNHEVLYRAYHLLCDSGHRHLLPKMVFVGMPGWGVGDLLKDIELDPKTEELIIQLNHVNDAELSKLYKHALFCVYPSLYEGWGLPVGEALAVGKAVLASNQGSLPEVGGDLVRYLEPWSARPWADAILELITTPAAIKKMEKRVVENYNVRTWEDAAKAVESLLNQVINDGQVSEKILYPGYDFSTQVGIPIGANIQSTGQHGYLMFGPYRSLQIGKYKVVVFDDSKRRTIGNLNVDCVGNGGKNCFWQGSFEVGSPKDNDDQPLFQFEFYVDEEVDDYEIRCIIDSASVLLTKVVVTNISQKKQEQPTEDLTSKTTDDIAQINSREPLYSTKNKAPDTHERQLFVDVSELVHKDARTGIQRVVRSILAELMANPPDGFRIEPIYATSGQGYRYARQFSWRFADSPVSNMADTPLKARKGDIFLGLDLQPYLVPQQIDFYAHLKLLGVEVYFVVYDLLPVLTPQNFPEGTSSVHAQWLYALSHSDGAICISRAVSDELVSWVSAHGPNRTRPFKLGWFHLGADVASSVPTIGFPADAEDVLSKLAKRPTFLMVGTVEPRKRQAQALSAFEKLWQQGEDINLVIVGKQGWMVDSLIDAMTGHSERNLRLFWLEGISDEYLEKIYSASTCLIASSEGEGFGLPLIEAAQHKKPIIARDIPVFREVAGKYAFYFSGLEPDALARVVREWLALDQVNQAPQSDNMPWLTWKQSTQNLLDVVLGGQWYRNWMPDDVRRFWGGDSRLGTQVGKRTGRDIVSTGQAGYLLFGPYVPLDAGQYRVVIRDALGENGLFGARMDVVVDKGGLILGESVLSAPDENGNFVALLISLDVPCTDLEVRVWVSNDTDLQVSMIEIAPWQGKQAASNADPEDIAGGVSPDRDAVMIELASQQQSAQVLSFSPTATEPIQDAAKVEAKVVLQELTDSSALVQPVLSMSSDKVAVINDNSDAAPSLQSAEVEMLSDHAQASNDVSASRVMAIPSAVQNKWKPSSTERNRAKTERKKKR